MTEIRRSRIGRPSVSRGRRSSSRGMTVSERGMAPKVLPSVKAGNKSFGIGHRPGQELDKSVAAGEGCEVPGAVRGPRHGPGTARLVAFHAYGHEEGERRLDRNRCAQRDFLRLARRGAHHG